MSPTASVPYATLAMYDRPELRPAWERLWAAVHDRAPWTPAELIWPSDVTTTWSDPACLVTQTCGWPAVTSLADVVDVVGAFRLGLPDADGHRYRSVLVAIEDRPPTVDADTVAAVNSDDSLSGWISLRAALAGGGEWPGPVVWTGGHRASLAAVQRDEAAIASIDALTLHHVRRFEPSLMTGLHVVGAGPTVPSLPIVVPRATPARRIEELRAAFIAGTSALDPNDRADLGIGGFSALGRGDYRPLLDLV